MELENIKALAAELAKNVKTEKDLNALTQQLLKMTVETALNTELSEHLGYEKHQPKPKGNARNGYTPKTLKASLAKLESPLRVIGKVVLNLNWSRNIRPDSPRWMIRY